MHRNPGRKEVFSMGNEIKRDQCPEKYYAKGNVLKDSIPVLIAIIVVAFLSGNMFRSSGLNMAVTIAIEAVVVLLFYGLFSLVFKGVKQRQAQTYISLCENGVCGICPLNGYKNRDFSLLYSEITKMTLKGDSLVLYSPKGNVVLNLTDPTGVAAIIRSKNSSL